MDGTRSSSPHSVLQRTEVFFAGRSPLVVAVLGMVFIAAVAVADAFVGRAISLSLLFLLPIALVTWNRGRRAGAAASLLSAVAGLVADVVSDPGASQLVPWLNAGARFLVYMAFSFLLATLHQVIAAQQEEVEEQSEVSRDLQEKNEAKDTLLHAVSHDLKQPLAGILGAVSTLRRGEELGLDREGRDDLYGMIETSGIKMLGLIDDLLDLERIDRGMIAPDRQPTEVGVLAASLSRELVALDGHPVDVDADPVLVEVDRAKVERIVENLLLNAARHTVAGTPIHVEVRGRRNGVVLAVEDEGPGVPPALREDLFEPFRQGAESKGGVGIGLSLVKRFAELHGGTAYVEDGRAGGARFVVILPGDVSPAPAPARAEAV